MKISPISVVDHGTASIRYNHSLFIEIYQKNICWADGYNEWVSDILVINRSKIMKVKISRSSRHIVAIHTCQFYSCYLNFPLNHFWNVGIAPKDDPKSEGAHLWRDHAENQQIPLLFPSLCMLTRVWAKCRVSARRTASFLHLHTLQILTWFTGCEGQWGTSHGVGGGSGTSWHRHQYLQQCRARSCTRMSSSGNREYS